MNNMENFGHLPYIHVFYLAWSWQIKDDWSTFRENFYTFDETVAMFPDQTSLSMLSMINESLSLFFCSVIWKENINFHCCNDMTNPLRLS